MGEGGRRIVYLDESRGLGGAEAYLAMLARHFARTDQVTIVHPDDGPHNGFYRGLGVRTVALPASAYRERPGLFLRYLALIRELNPDFLHLNLPAPDFCRLAAVAGRTAGVGVVATSHLPSLHFPRSFAGRLAGKALWDRLAWRTVYSCIDRTIVVSRSGVASLLSHYPVREEKVRCVPNGVDRLRFREVREEEVAGVRRGLGLAPGLRVITSIGGLLPQKGYRTLLEAFAGVAEKQGDVRLLLVGDGPLRGELEDHAASLGIAERVGFAGRRQDIPAILAASHLYVNSSRFEGLPFTILEAMAAGVPVIATAVDGNAEVVRDGETGLLVPAERAAELAEALRTLLADGALRKRLTERADALVRERYSIEAMLAGTAQVYEEALACRPAGRGGRA